MTSKLVSRLFVCVTAGASLLPGTIVRAQTSASGLMEEAAAPGANYDKAEFRFRDPAECRDAARRACAGAGVQRRRSSGRGGYRM